jgi:hypothetical protein
MDDSCFGVPIVQIRIFASVAFDSPILYRFYKSGWGQSWKVRFQRYLRVANLHCHGWLPSRFN